MGAGIYLFTTKQEIPVENPQFTHWGRLELGILVRKNFYGESPTTVIYSGRDQSLENLGIHEHHNLIALEANTGEIQTYPHGPMEQDLQYLQQEHGIEIGSLTPVGYVYFENVWDPQVDITQNEDLEALLGKI